MVHIHNHYYSAIKRNTFESGLMRWMNLEPILQNEVSQKKINTVYQSIFMESRKMVPKNLFARQQWINRQRTNLWTQGEGKRGLDVWQE